MSDKLDTLNRRLKETSEKFKALIDSGMDEEILICYLQQKTKLSKKNIKDLLRSWEEFYDRICGEVVAEEL